MRKMTQGPWSVCYSDEERDFLLVSPTLTAYGSLFTFQFEKGVFELCGMSKSTPPPLSLPPLPPRHSCLKWFAE